MVLCKDGVPRSADTYTHKKDALVAYHKLKNLKSIELGVLSPADTVGDEHGTFATPTGGLPHCSFPSGLTLSVTRGPMYDPGLGKRKRCVAVLDGGELSVDIYEDPRDALSTYVSLRDMCAERGPLTEDDGGGSDSMSFIPDSPGRKISAALLWGRVVPGHIGHRPK